MLMLSSLMSFILVNIALQHLVASFNKCQAFLCYMIYPRRLNCFIIIIIIIIIISMLLPPTGRGHIVFSTDLEGIGVGVGVGVALFVNTISCIPLVGLLSNFH